MDNVLKEYPWLCGSGDASYTIVLQPLVIRASAASVWSLLCDTGRYEELSGGQLVAKVDGELRDGCEILTGVRPVNMGSVKGALLGRSLGESRETVMLRERERALGWTRSVPMTSEKSVRWQVVVDEGEFTCTYYSGIMIPSSIAIFLTGSEIFNAFAALAKGIQQEAEKNSSIPAWAALPDVAFAHLVSFLEPEDVLKMLRVCSRWRKLMLAQGLCALLSEALTLLVPAFDVAVKSSSRPQWEVANALMALTSECIMEDGGPKTFSYHIFPPVSFDDTRNLWYGSSGGGEHLMVGYEDDMDKVPMEPPGQSQPQRWGHAAGGLLRDRFCVFTCRDSREYHLRFFDMELLNWTPVEFPCPEYSFWELFDDDDVIFWVSKKNECHFRQVMFDEDGLPHLLMDRADLKFVGKYRPSQIWRAPPRVHPGRLCFDNLLLQRIPEGITSIAPPFANGGRGTCFAGFYVFRLDESGLLHVKSERSNVTRTIKTGIKSTGITPIVCGNLCFVLSCVEPGIIAIVDWKKGKVLSNRPWGIASSGVMRPCYGKDRDCICLWMLADGRAPSPQIYKIRLF